jgi:phosphoserine phosphatase RsbU/P
VAEALNRRFASGRGGSQFFSLIYAIVNVRTRQLSYTSAGHPPIMHHPAGGSPAMLEGGGMPVGLAPENTDYFEETIQLNPGDRLMLYSDGLGDAVNTTDQLFGSAQLLQYTAAASHRPLREWIDGLLIELKNWRGGNEIK